MLMAMVAIRSMGGGLEEAHAEMRVHHKDHMVQALTSLRYGEAVA